MTKKSKTKDPLPEQFDSYEAAAEFWDNHDTTDYPEAFVDVSEPVEIEIKKRYFEVEVDEPLATILRQQAKEQGLSVGHLISELLRKQLHPAA